MHCFVRFDADREIGMGHAHRCLALADALRRNGAPVTVLTRTPDVIAPLAGRIPVIQISGTETDALSAHTRPGDIAVLDYAETAGADIRAIRTGLAGVQLVLIGNREPASLADLVIRQTPLGPETPRSDELSGPQFILIKRSFEGLALRQVRSEPRRLLVCLGGGRPRGLHWILDLINRTAPACIEEIHVAGPGVSGAVPASPRRSFICDESSNDLAAAMALADLAILSGGGIIYEAAASGLPALYCPVVAHQEALALQAQRAGFGWLCPAFAARDEEAFSQQLASFAGDHDGRAQLAKNGQALIDGLGADRIARRLLSQSR